jgi:hypothetical protein
MKKVIKLTESDLVRIVKRVISEQTKDGPVVIPKNAEINIDSSVIQDAKKMGIDFIIFVSNMKTLIIHPEDYTTDFLETIYYGLDNKTVLRNEFSVAQVCALIESHDRVFMMGHGSPSGLFSMGLSTEFSSFAVDHKIVKALSSKKNNYFISDEN